MRVEVSFGLQYGRNYRSVTLIYTDTSLTYTVTHKIMCPGHSPSDQVCVNEREKERGREEERGRERKREKERRREEETEKGLSTLALFSLEDERDGTYVQQKRKKKQEKNRLSCQR